MATRRVDWINNLWKARAHDPVTLRRAWESIEQIMAPGALDACTKEMIYLTVSVTNQCNYCIASHTRQRSQGRHDGRDVCRSNGRVGMASETKWLLVDSKKPLGFASCK